MQNITKAAALRHAISNMLGVRPSRIELMEQPLDPNFIPQNNEGSTVTYKAEEQYHDVYGVNLVNICFRKLDIKRAYRMDCNGNINSEEGESIADYVARTGEVYHIFVVNSYGKNEGEDASRYDEYYAYKTPDFATHWIGVTESDIKVWNIWTNPDSDID